MKKETKKLDYEKLAKVMLWEKFEGETYEQVFLRKDIKPSHTPDPYIVDVVSYESLENWAKHGEFKSLEELQSEIIFIFKRAVVDKINSEKSMQKLFPPIYNFCVFATNTDKRGKITAEAEKIAEKACEFVKGPVYHRSDVGTEELVQKRVNHMNEIKGL